MPDGQWTWYAIEFDGEDLCFGYVIGFDAELGYFRLSGLMTVRGASASRWRFAGRAGCVFHTLPALTGESLTFSRCFSVLTGQGSDPLPQPIGHELLDHPP
jgi:hypothetical protein